MTTESVQFRLAEHDDLPDIVAIYNQNIASHMVTAEIEPVTVMEREDWFAQHTPDKWPMWVATRGGQVVGWVSLSQWNTRAAYSGTAEISIYIDAAAKGQHIGTLAVQWAEAHAAAARINTIITLIIGANKPSIGLFKKLGYEQWGFLPAVMRFADRNQDLVLLGKTLV
ncbi:GNAT family N-acetyltransferase [Lacticaseibacillus sharpeae]|uniref:Phosphinothricin N-acetyltransferase n=1 Tax=Lacticaseibacillus sharpeae JCM 1186 = DSM 20505 TaxID=1291052 RepID=A0A0R1ZHL8_9LACO|nr:GNAT family N-acetyltransferase [Lacticaseibacillus sharpeae]KRM54382.1 phosphinothricin N-acetyltransferase [Lacticaseibacillus sharpeae JCM 1186 = DSM 20505]